jgi:DnaJ-class molecular chaperone
MAQVDYYTILGVGREAGPEELKQAYRRLAIHWHPDRNHARGAEERFKAIAEAYAVLSNPAKRRQYDLLGLTGFKSEYSQKEIFQGFEPGDFFEFFGLPGGRDTLARIFDETPPPSAPSGPEVAAPPLGEFFEGFGQKNATRDTRSPDILIPLAVSFQEAALGAEKFVAYNTDTGPVKIPVTIPAGARPSPAASPGTSSSPSPSTPTPISPATASTS